MNNQSILRLKAETNLIVLEKERLANELSLVKCNNAHFIPDKKQSKKNLDDDFATNSKSEHQICLTYENDVTVHETLDIFPQVETNSLSSASIDDDFATHSKSEHQIGLTDENDLSDPTTDTGNNQIPVTEDVMPENVPEDQIDQMHSLFELENETENGGDELGMGERPNEKQEKSYTMTLELVDSETKYNDSLTFLLTDLRIGILSRLWNENQFIGIKPSQLTFILGNLNKIKKLSDDFLDDFKMSLENRTPISQVFVHKASFLKIYRTFLTNYRNKLDLLDRLVNRSQRLARALASIEMEEEAKGQTIKAHFEKVITRIQEYKTFLTVYAVDVKDDDQEEKATTKAKLEIEKVLEFVYGNDLADSAN